MPIHGRVNGDTHYLLPNGAVTVTRMVNWEDVRREMEEDY